MLYVGVFICLVMSHTYVQNTVHVIFSTKERAPVISATLRPHVWNYIHGICRKNKIFCQAIGGTADHLHLLIQIPANLSLAQTVGLIKSNSSRWISQQGAKFSWQANYAAFSVSHSAVPTVVRYIDGQENHHRRMDFRAEILALLKKHEVRYDLERVLG
jgi:putative transposase